jgi:NADPH:quinone reductase
MFTRPLFQTRDMIAQHHLLNAVADLIDSKKIKTTLTDQLVAMTSRGIIDYELF